MLSLMVLMIILCTEWLFEMFDTLSCTTFCSDFFFTTEFLTETTCDGGDCIRFWVTSNRTKTIKETVPRLKGGIALTPWHDKQYLCFVQPC